MRALVTLPLYFFDAFANAARCFEADREVVFLQALVFRFGAAALVLAATFFGSASCPRR